MIGPEPRKVTPAILLLCIAGLAWAQPGLEWADLHDGGAQMADLGVAALTDAQGNLVVAGESSGSQGIVGLLVRKLDRETAATIWSRQITPADGSGAIPRSMIWDGYGNILVAGHIRNCFG